MTGPNLGPIGPLDRRGAEPADRDAAAMRKASHDLEGVFVNELFKAMRATVPADGILSQDSGGELFSSMLDQRLAEVYAERERGGLGEALYRQLSRRLNTPQP